MQFIDLKAQYNHIKEDINENIQVVLESNQYMMGPFVKELEQKLAEYVGVKHCVTCANGTDALQLALMVWDIKAGDAVFLPSFTFYATAEVVSLAGATPIFVDTNPRTFNIDTKKLEKAIIEVQKEGTLVPRVIIPVDLFGQPADFEAIYALAKRYNLLILEDGAQGFGGSIDGKKACSFGDIATTSFFPAKPLGCYGDGGALFTDNDEYYDILISLRVHGKGKFKYDNVRVGLNSRLDTLQAGILLPKLRIFKEHELDNRNTYAQIYSTSLENVVEVPYVPKNMISSWAQYTVLLNSFEEREYLQNKLKERDIPTMIYYPTPLHKQKVYEAYNFNLSDLNVSEEISQRCLSLPMHPYLDEKKIETICDEIKTVVKEYRHG